MKIAVFTEVSVVFFQAFPINILLGFVVAFYLIFRILLFSNESLNVKVIVSRITGKK
jgi:hypothetical protein